MERIKVQRKGLRKNMGRRKLERNELSNEGNGGREK